MIRVEAVGREAHGEVEEVDACACGGRHGPPESGVALDEDWFAGSAVDAHVEVRDAVVLGRLAEGGAQLKDVSSLDESEASARPFLYRPGDDRASVGQEGEVNVVTRDVLLDDRVATCFEARLDGGSELGLVACDAHELAALAPIGLDDERPAWIDVVQAVEASDDLRARARESQFVQETREGGLVGELFEEIGARHWESGRFKAGRAVDHDAGESRVRSDHQARGDGVRGFVDGSRGAVRVALVEARESADAGLCVRGRRGTRLVGRESGWEVSESAQAEQGAGVPGGAGQNQDGAVVMGGQDG